jgi:cell wall-associated NlpC family hydrolase
LPDLAADALKYQGAGYEFGGVPATGIGHWDCSSYINWCWGSDLGQSIPGYAAGTYHGQVHGPVVLDYATWNGASTHGGNPNRGDLCVWAGIGASGHIGIALADNQMISALNHVQGTVVTPIQGYGPAGVSVIFRTINGNSSSGGMSLPSGCAPSLVVMAYALQHRIKRRQYRQGS